MAKWNHTVDCRAFWRDYAGGRATIQEIARKFRAELLKLPESVRDDEFDWFDADLEGLSLNDETTVDDFDETLAAIYDWADENRVWIATF